MISFAIKSIIFVAYTFLSFNEKIFSGFGVGVLLRDSGKISIKPSMGQKLLHIGMSLLLTMTIENITISFTSPVFNVVGFLKFTTIMVGVVYVTPWLSSRIKAKDL